MSTKRTTILLGELKESFHMAMSALTAHKLLGERHAAFRQRPLQITIG